MNWEQKNVDPFHFIFSYLSTSMMAEKRTSFFGKNLKLSISTKLQETELCRKENRDPIYEPASQLRLANIWIARQRVADRTCRHASVDVVTVGAMRRQLQQWTHMVVSSRQQTDSASHTTRTAHGPMPSLVVAALVARCNTLVRGLFTNHIINQVIHAHHRVHRAAISSSVCVHDD